MASEKKKKPNILTVLKPYKGGLALLLLFALGSNGVNLLIPKLIEKGIDDYTRGVFDMSWLVRWFLVAVIIIFVLSYFQTILQTFVSEKVARHLRSRLTEKISGQHYGYIQEHTAARLLTNITSDVNAIKTFVSQAMVSILSSVILIVGAGILLLSIDAVLGGIVLLMIPIIGVTFLLIFKRVKTLFRKTQEVIDWLNKVINESIMGAALIRVLNAQFSEYNKFLDASSEAKNLGLSILRLFATLIPIIVLTASLARLAVLAMGGHFVIEGTMTLGELAAFNSYVAILIFPILIIGFMSNVIARASASYQRIHNILEAPDPMPTGNITETPKGNIEVKDVSLFYGEQAALKNISFRVAAGSRTAVIGPTASGKTQLMHLLATLIPPSSGAILYDGIPTRDYRQDILLGKIGLVFQDSILFNLTIRENIAFNQKVTDEDLQKAIDTAELRQYIDNLPLGLNAIVSERGTAMSGGQKQRLMLARALAINPEILLLDDFTARVDPLTAKSIGENISNNYPGITIVSITQRIDAIMDFENIVLIMEGEIVAQGTHKELLSNCPEYMQIFQSQKSVSHAEAT